MRGRSRQVAYRCGFYNLTELHGRNTINNVCNNAKVVGYEQHPRTRPCLQFPLQCLEVALDHDIEGRGWFVSDQGSRMKCRRDSDNDPLALLPPLNNATLSRIGAITIFSPATLSDCCWFHPCCSRLPSNWMSW